MSNGADVLTTVDTESVFGAVRRGLRENRLLATGLLMALAIVVVALLAPVLAPSAPDATHPLQTLLAPSSAHWFGTDQLGRDLYSRVLFGTRISPVIAFLVLAISCGVGIPLGIVAGYYGGLVDEVIMRVTDVFLAFPALLLALALAAVLPPRSARSTLAVSVTWWPWYTRLVRGAGGLRRGTTVTWREPRHRACRISRIMLRHVLPNSLTPLVVQVSLDVAAVILTVSALSFLGLGAQDPTPEWGLMVSQGQLYFPGQWWLVTFPGLAIVMTAVAFNLLGDGLRDCWTQAVGNHPMNAPRLALRDVAIGIGGRRIVGLDRLELAPGEVVGLAGESGSGKSMTAQAILGLARSIGADVRGSIRLDGEELVGLPESKLRGIRGRRIAMIFQSPVSSMNPVFRIGDVFIRALRLHGAGSKRRGRVPDEGRAQGGAPGSRPARAISEPALRRTGPTGRDRDGPRAPIGGPACRRADERARRHRAAGDPRSPARCARRDGHERPVHQPRPRRIGRALRSRRGDAGRPHRRDGTCSGGPHAS